MYDNVCASLIFNNMNGESLSNQVSFLQFISPKNRDAINFQIPFAELPSIRSI